MRQRLFSFGLCLFILVLGPLVYSFAEEKKPLSVDDIGNLLKSNVSRKRVLMTIEEHGVGFPKTKNTLEGLQKLGADGPVLAAIEKEWKEDGRILIVETDPKGAIIYLDGEKMGETPVEIEGLRPRKYSVRVEKEGYEEVDHEISLIEGAGRKLTVSLMKSEKEAPPPRPPEPPPPAPTPSRPPQMCSIFINTHPTGAKIYVNGKHYGTSPKYIEVPPGEHSIVLVKEFYRPEERTIIIREGETVSPPIDQRLVPTR